MIRKQKEYERKSAKLESMASEIESLEKRASECFAAILQNQEAYDAGHLYSLRVNDKLGHEMDKCRMRAKKLGLKCHDLDYEVNMYKKKVSGL